MSHRTVFFLIVKYRREQKGENKEDSTYRLSRFISSKDSETKSRLHPPKVNIQLLIIWTCHKELNNESYLSTPLRK